MASVYHRKDIIVFILLIPIINTINYFITYTNISFNLYFFTTFLIDTLQGYLAWLLIRFVILRLEKRYPLEDFSWKRLLSQLAFTCILGLSVIVLLTELLNAMVKDTPVPNNFYTHDIFIYLIWILVINGIYIGMYYYHVWKTSAANLHKEQTLKSVGISLKIGNKNTKIPLSDVHGFYVEDGSTYIIDQQLKIHLMDNSLDGIEKKVSDKMFFRVNRQFLLKRNSILSYRRIGDGKLLLTIALGNSFPSEITMSRLKAPAFKKWFMEDVL